MGGNERGCWEMGVRNERKLKGVLGNGGEEWEEMKGCVGKWGRGMGGNERACWEIGVKNGRK